RSTLEGRKYWGFRDMRHAQTRSHSGSARWDGFADPLGLHENHDRSGNDSEVDPDDHNGLPGIGIPSLESGCESCQNAAVSPDGGESPQDDPTKEELRMATAKMMERSGAAMPGLPMSGMPMSGSTGMMGTQTTTAPGMNMMMVPRCTVTFA